MPKYFLSDIKIQMKIFCVCYVLQITPVFEVKAKINVSVPSDVINKLKLDRFYHNGPFRN